MAEDFHKPTLFAGSTFEAFQGGDDPAHISRLAHDTAAALLSRVRADPDAGVIDRLIAYTDVNGIDAIAELWSRSSARSLPGALWRIYLLRALTRQDPEQSSFIYQRGADLSLTIDPVVAGAPNPTGPEEITALADQILRGLFEGDFAVALDRAAAFCRLMSSGCASLADDAETTSAERATALTTRALRFHSIAADLTACARLWRSGSLD
ncbi:DNA-directed RNA polymerase subunit beta [Subtercola sp. PAMC28395]|uniref:DNA-directed RNA polymerase subunit beta n=1 Tax=Subtercola sp. PAMC28395 TaxID=2846775 RepID=UPI001C0DA5F0|nr:DNA-directed RNA polymerase subunit beta [Subtercola sp. PAMC28395]QWT23952.1 DNA-directed RNA polymerase subunit beta [Subtercola sp. PAMC28395]